LTISDLTTQNTNLSGDVAELTANDAAQDKEITDLNSSVDVLTYMNNGLIGDVSDLT
jgi:hypothetical protein